MPTSIWCIRHGETAWNASGRWQGRAPVPLNDAGLAQSAALGRYLRRAGPGFAALYSSPAPRALQTAQAIVADTGVSIQIDERLHEVNLGDWQGLTRQEAQTWDRQRFAAFEADWHAVAPPNGESRKQLKARARAAFDAIAARHDGQTVAIVTHGGTLGMLIESLFGPVERPTLRNTSITIIERAAGGSAWQLTTVAWTPHLDHPAIGETW